MSVATERLPRNIRQAEIVPQEILERVAAVIVGCGAIGSFLGQFLAHMGVPYFVLVDPDTVSDENLALQGYRPRHLGLNKAHALAAEIVDINDNADVKVFDCPFDKAQLAAVPAMYDRLAVFCCVDDIELRGRIFRMVRRRCKLFVDGRMGALVWRVITVDAWPDLYYLDTLFARSEANVLRCTAKGTVFTAAAPALQMGANLMLWIKGCTVADGGLRQDVEGNLLATTFEAVTEPED
jgi:molybdopterin-synthase adenylyltransferase